MHVVSIKALRAFWEIHADSERSLRLWFKATERASWATYNELRRTFASADTAKVGSGNTVVIFDIGGNKYRLVAAVHYNRERVFVLKIMTHKEYSRDAWKGQL